MTTPALPLAAALGHGPVLLDGGLSNQLEAQSCDLSDELWSARLLADGPEQLTSAHAAYVRAGARVLISGSYQASFEGFARRGASREEARALFGRSVALARTAAAGGAAGTGADGGTEAGGVWVAGSVGPYGAVCADGSEYRGRYGLTVRELAAFHRPRVDALAEAAPDVLALETVPDVDEAEALLEAVRGCGVPVWLSFTVEGGRTRAGQPLEEAFAVAAGRDEVIAVGVNCCAAEDVGHAVELAVAVTGKPAVAYPNSGEGWDQAHRSWRGPVTFGAGSGAQGAGPYEARTGGPGPGPDSGPGLGDAPALVRGWIAGGARLVGGCCRVGPGTIARLAAELR